LDEQIVSDEQIICVRLMCKRDEQFSRRTSRLIFVGLERRFFPDDLSVVTNTSTIIRHKFTDSQMPDDLSVQTILFVIWFKSKFSILKNFNIHKYIPIKPLDGRWQGFDNNSQISQKYSVVRKRSTCRKPTLMGILLEYLS